LSRARRDTLPRLAARRKAVYHYVLAPLGRVLEAIEICRLGTGSRLPDYSRGEADLEIRFGNGMWPDTKAAMLYLEELAPVAAPHLLDGSADWRTLPRIATSGPRLGWRDWTIAAPRSMPDGWCGYRPRFQESEILMEILACPAAPPASRQRKLSVAWKNSLLRD